MYIPKKEEVNAILDENDKRIDKMFGYYDQYSGKGVHGHDRKVVIADYVIRTQYLTSEVADNPFYKWVAKCGSIRTFIEDYEKKTGEELTVDEVTNQLFITRCQRDPAFAFFTCFKIKSKTEGKMVPFRLNYAQRVVLAVLEDMRMDGTPIRIVLLKARQWGGSTLVQLYMAWIQIFVKEGWYSVVIAQTKDTAKRIKAMYKKVLDDFPAFVFDTEKLQFSPYEKSASDSIIADSKGNKVRDNVITVASYENFESTRGMDYALAHFSEVAYWRTTPGKDANEVITNIDGGILNVPLTMEVAESTACGMEGYFYNEYKLAKEGKSNRKAVFIPFYFIENDMKKFRDKQHKKNFVRELLMNRHNPIAPDEAHESGQYLWQLWEKGASLEHIQWYIEKRKSFHDHAQMASEAPSDDIECFKFSGNRVFSIYFIDTMREQYCAPPVFCGDITSNGKATTLTTNPAGLLKIWKHPDKLNTTNQYIVSVDVGGRSDKADYSVITVVNRLPIRLPDGKLEVVARWRGHLRYDLMARKAMTIARYYKNAMLVFESNTFDKKQAEANEYVEQGDHIRGILNEIGDEYSNLYMRSATDPEDIRQGIYRKIGFQTNRKTKQDMVDNFIVTFEDGHFIDPDENFYTEASIYEQRTDGSYGNIPGRGNHDDILMTDMIAALVSNEMPMPTIVRQQDNERNIFRGTQNESAF
jgi:hypothetical protein